MYLGGTRISSQITQIVRYAGLLLPVVLLVYGYSLLELSGAPVERYIIYSVIAVLWVALALWQFIWQEVSVTATGIRIALYHLLAAAYLLFVSGVGTPFVICWIILMLVANVFFGRRGVALSTFTFLAVFFVNFLLHSDYTTLMLVSDVTALTAVLLSGLAIVGISRAQEVSQTELRRSHTQESLQRSRIMSIINNITDAVLSVDSRGIIRVYNAASLSLLDTNDNLAGKHIDEVVNLIDQDDAPVSLSHRMEARTSVATFDDAWHTFEDGERIRLEITLSPVRSTFGRKSRRGDGFIVIMRDVTKAKSLEEERDEFISVVSHELRTPATVVEGALSNLEVMLERDNVDKAKLQDAVSLAHTQVVYLARMINDLSTLSRAERGLADEKERIDVRSLVQRLYDSYAPEAHDKHLAFDLDTSASLGEVEVSRLYLEELLQNFITNAIKYTVTGSVTLSATQRGGIITFAVKDTGIGIARTEQAKIFEKFYRSEDYRTRETGGTGLGLYVVTKLARKLGTKVELTSRINYGSTFSFSLPVATQPDEQA